MRFQSASDLAFALRGLIRTGDSRPVDPHAARPLEPRSPRKPWIPVALGLTTLVIGVLLGIAVPAIRAPAAAPVAEFLIPPPGPNQSFAPLPLPGLAPTSPQVGLSPDGRQVAFVATDPGGVRRLWIRSLDNGVPRVLERSEGVSSWPFWSPDGRFVMIAASGALKKIDVATGNIERFSTLPADAPPVPFVTGSWNEDGTILFSLGGPRGLYRASASGGDPQPATKRDAGRGDEYHSWPQILPGGRFLFFVRTNDARTTGVYAGSVDSGETLVLANASRAVYAAGHLLWVVEDRLVAQPFDPSRLRLSGQPVTLVSSVFQGAGRTPAFWASDDGTLVYGIGGSPERQFRWFDRVGTALDQVGQPGLYVTFDLSADGSRVVTEVAKPGPTPRSSLSNIDTARGVMSVLTLGDNNDSDPRFGPDGDLAFARNSGPSPGIIRTDLSGTNQSVLMARGKLPVIWLEAWSGGRGALVYRSGADRDAWELRAGIADPRRLTQAREPIEQVAVSPDARWIAYNTAETGRMEVHVSSPAGNGQRWQVSADGGVQATWRADGRELYYLGLDGGLYAVGIRPDAAAPQIAPPRLLFRTALPVISAVVEQYRPTGDGQRFLFCLPLTSVQKEPLRMLLNWPARLARAQ